MKIVFVDMNEKFISALKNAFNDAKDVTYTLSHVQYIPVDYTAFVSFTPSVITMLPLCHKMFPGVEARVFEKMALLGCKGATKCSLSVGNSILTTAPSNSYFVVAPMDAAMDAYQAFLATLCVIRKYIRYDAAIENIVLSAPICLNDEEVLIAKEFKRAYDDYLAGAFPQELKFFNRHDVFMSKI